MLSSRQPLQPILESAGRCSRHSDTLLEAEQMHMQYGVNVLHASAGAWGLMPAVQLSFWYQPAALAGHPCSDMTMMDAVGCSTIWTTI